MLSVYRLFNVSRVIYLCTLMVGRWIHVYLMYVPLSYTYLVIRCDLLDSVRQSVQIVNDVIESYDNGNLFYYSEENGYLDVVDEWICSVFTMFSNPRFKEDFVCHELRRGLSTEQQWIQGITLFQGSASATLVSQ